MLSVALDTTTGAHGVCVNGVMWLAPDVATAGVKVGGTFLSTQAAGPDAPATLVPSRAPARSQGTDAVLGDYDEWRFFWRAAASDNNATLMETAVRAFTAADATVVFLQRFPEALDLGGTVEVRTSPPTTAPRRR